MIPGDGDARIIPDGRVLSWIGISRIGRFLFVIPFIDLRLTTHYDQRKQMTRGADGPKHQLSVLSDVPPASLFALQHAIHLNIASFPNK